MCDLKTLQTMFVERIPAMRDYAKLRFLGLRPEARQEALANTLALCWKFAYALLRQGRIDSPEILGPCLYFAARQTRSGRKVQRKNSFRDVLDRRRSGKVKFVDFDLSDFAGRTTPIPEQVSFRIDIPAFFNTLTDRQRRMAADLASGLGTCEVAQRFGISNGRVSQFRREFKQLYDAYFAK